MLEALSQPLTQLLSIGAAGVGAYAAGRNDKARRTAIRFETHLRDLVERRWGLPSPSTAEISRDEIDAALVEAIPAFDGSGDPVDIVFSDGRYLAPVATDVEVLRGLASATSWLPYRPERFDCEQFATAFQTLSAFVGGSNCVGVVYDWSAGHAYNVIVDAAGEVTLYEPQEDRIVELGDDLDGDGDPDYVLENGMVMF